ncbi:baseplate J/gp47 family protein [Duganella sp.]|uniref:baseplate J/gp47 family protein n=1 Tax=Duganella sp. TaxID=1904440 RepID=UPI0031D7BC13
MSARLIVSDGRDQQHRRPPALCGDYFQLNEMSFEQLAALAAEYARLMRFFQLDLRAEGDWHDYFGADETVLMATILAIDTNAMLARFEQRLQGEPAYHKWFRADIQQPLNGAHRDRLDSPLLVARALDAWMTAVLPLQGHAGQEVRTLLEGILRGMKRELAELVQAAPSSFMRVAHHVFSVRFMELTALHEMPAEEASPSAIRHNFHTLTQAVRMLQNGIRELLPPSLLSGDHDPGISLLIAFIRLFQQLLVRLNRFGDKRIDFYYQRVLGMRPQPQQPDSAFLVIKPTAAARQIQIDAGTEFIGGVDAQQQDIIYAADNAATLNDARVSALHSLYFERRPVVGTSGGYHRQFDLLELDGDEREHEKMPALPLMGAPKPGEPLNACEPAAFGFILSSKVLLMREGERTVRVLFQYRVPSHTSRLSLEDSLQRVLEQVRADPKRSQAEVRAIRISDVFVRLFRSMFRISLTTESGWYQVAEYRPEYSGLNPDVPADCLAIEFALPASAPAIVPYNPLVHGAAYDSHLPLLRFDMTQNEYRYPYDLLADLILHDIRIEVDVKAVRQLLLHNQIGQLSALSPFMPFGPLPAVGSYMVIGCEEILYKPLRDVSIDVEWTGMPTGLGGFPDYYRGYPEPLNSDDVEAGVAVLTDGKWLRAGGTVKLFRYQLNPDGSLSNLTSDDNTISLRAAVQFYKPVDAMPEASGAAFQYTSASMNGLFKLTLDGPSGALGHQEYPALLSRVLTQNAQLKKNVLMQPLPNAPYTPVISRIALNYRATATITFERSRRSNSPSEADSFIHLHPLGWQSMYFSDTRIIRQVPRYTSPGQLFIGVQGRQLRGTLSLYFYLREDSLPMSGIASAGLQWRYLSGNRWRVLAPNLVLEDSTKGFMTSGIVLLQLPEDIDLDNTVMPSGQFWLCVSAEEGVERFCSLYSVYAQAIKVTWRADRGAKPQAVMPAMHITRSRENIPGIDSVYQVRRSFDGKSAETALQFRVRASERLRHKNRALTASDFEQLILEQFPQVYKVKCFPNLCVDDDPARRVRPGHILIVAIPYLNRGGHVNQKPTLSGYLVNEIEQYVRRYASPDAVISVQNPVYEEVQVRCTVKLASQLNTGRLSERINQALCDYLSPWNGQGIHQHFGWTLRQHDVVSFLLDLGYVEAVTGVSLLQIAPWGKPIDRLYRLHDNAIQTDIQKKVIQPSYPWSIAVPMNQHWIVLSDQSVTKEATPIGINQLKVGSTFIIPTRKES